MSVSFGYDNLLSDVERLGLVPPKSFTDDPLKVGAWCRGQIERGLDKRRPEEVKWDAIDRLERGDVSGVRFDPIARAFVRTDTRPTGPMPALIANLLRPKLRLFVATIIRGDELWAAVPVDSQNEELEAASRTANRLYRSLYETIGVKAKEVLAAFYLGRYGNAGLFPRWNPSRGPRDAEVINGVDGIPLATGREVPQGDVDVDVLSPREYVVDPSGREPQGIKWFARCVPRTIPELLDRFPDLSRDQRTDDLIPNGYSAEDRRKPLEVWEFYHRPTREYPEGGFVILLRSTGRVLYARNHLPEEAVLRANYPNPGHHLIYSLQADTPWGEGMMWPAAPLQVEIASVLWWAIQVRKRIGNPLIFAQTGQLDGAEPLRSRIGEIVVYKGTGTVQPNVVYPVRSSGFEALMQQLTILMDDITAQHDSFQGRTPSELSGLAINLLTQRDQTALSETAAFWDGAWASVGEHLRLLAAQHYGEGRIVQFIGRDQETAPLDISRSLLESVRVIVRPRDALPRSKAARDALVFQLWQGGLIQPLFFPPGASPEADAQREAARFVLQLFEFGQIERLLDVARTGQTPQGPLGTEQQMAMQGIAQLIQQGQGGVPAGAEG